MGWLASWTWLQLLGLLCLSLLASGAGFLLGYLVRSAGKTTAGSESLESELRFLEDETRRAKDSLAQLLKAANRRPRPYQAGVQTMGGGASLAFWGRLWKRITDYFDGKDQAQDEGPLVTRLRQVKLDIKFIKENIEDTAKFYSGTTTQAAPNKGHSGIPFRGMSNSLEDDRGDETLPGVRSGAKHATRDSATELPTIGSHYRDETTALAHTSRHEEVAGPPAIPPAGAEIVEMYNRAVNDPFERERFREQYAAMRVGTVNAVERRQNPTIEAEYREASDGDLFAYAVGRDEFIVVPRLGLTIESVRYTAGALGEVFGYTQGHDPQRFYSRYRVLHPAIFKRDGDHWQLTSPGELELGPGD